MSQCSICHNELGHRNILYLQWYQEKLVAVENVPADVCPNCGEEFDFETEQECRNYSDKHEGQCGSCSEEVTS